ncbi:MAG TPA: hypothetical protein VFO45_06560 [Sphingomicrobium sp.]|nr:hypothetical protein [Sphingomicrobium sp.]
MSARGFGSILWAGAVAGAALGFYLVSLNVASERTELEEVETKIALAQRDIRLLQTEIGTRGRLAQLERWNVKFIRLSAPTADQFVDGGFQLATLVTPQKKPAIEAPVVLASAQVDRPFAGQPGMSGEAGAAQQASRPVSEMVHVASYSVPDRPASINPIANRPVATRPPTAKPDPARSPTEMSQRQAAATKPAKAAMVDPLAPLSSGKPKAKGSPPSASAGAIGKNRTTKDRVTD